MAEDRFVVAVERYAWLIILVSFVAVGFLFLASFQDWDETSGGVFPADIWRHPVFMAGTVGALMVCITAMLVAVTAEARRDKALRDSLNWHQRGSDEREDAHRVRPARKGREWEPRFRADDPSAGETFESSIYRDHDETKGA